MPAAKGNCKTNKKIIYIKKLAKPKPIPVKVKKERYFKCVHNKRRYGRIHASKPRQAANKAFSSILKRMKKSEQPYNLGDKITFSIIECTRGSKCNRYCYTGERRVLKNPIVSKRKVTHADGSSVTKNVTHRYKNYIRKVKKADMEPLEIDEIDEIDKNDIEEREIDNDDQSMDTMGRFDDDDDPVLP